MKEAKMRDFEFGPVKTFKVSFTIGSKKAFIRYARLIQGIHGFSNLSEAVIHAVAHMGAQETKRHARGRREENKRKSKEGDK